jgi:hypothetical protein
MSISCHLELSNYYKPHEVCGRCGHPAEAHPYWKRRPSDSTAESIQAEPEDVRHLSDYLYDHGDDLPEATRSALQAVLTTVYSYLRMDVVIGVIVHRWDLADVMPDVVTDAFESVGLVGGGSRVFAVYDPNKAMTDKQRCDLARVLGPEWYVSQRMNINVDGTFD